MLDPSAFFLIDGRDNFSHTTTIPESGIDRLTCLMTPFRCSSQSRMYCVAFIRNFNCTHKFKGWTFFQGLDMKLKLLIIYVTIISLFSIGHAQDSTITPSPQSEIRMTAFVTDQEVPLNRTVSYIIRVEWVGELDNYEISEIENPELRNLKVIKTSSADRRESSDGVLKAIKTFEFELQPEELGMGYIEGVIIKYIDKSSGNGQHLVTNRLQVKVIDPLPEPGSKNWIYWLIGLLGMGSAGAFGLYAWWRKREELKRAQEALKNELPMERILLDELKKSIPLNDASLNLEGGFAMISSIFRRYVSDRYGFAATKSLKEDIIEKLKQNAVDDSLINNAIEILDKCDIVKFSGVGAERSELERVFTLLEGFILNTLTSEQSVQNKN